jgi:hypothetical protein
MMRDYSYHIGVCGAATMAVSDVILLGTSYAGWQTDMASYTVLAEIPLWRIELGSMMGWIASFFVCFGYWYVSRLHRTHHPVYARAMFASLSAVMIFGGAFHAAYYFYALYPTVAVMARLQLMSYIAVPPLLLGAYLYDKLHVGHRLRWANPLLLQAIVLLVFTILPAPVGGYLKPTFVNVATLLFLFLHRYDAGALPRATPL